jgi:hypothetical protein
MDGVNINRALKEMTEFLASQMQINLGAKVKRKTYRSNWKNGKPFNTRIKSIRASHDASGALISSIKVKKSNIGYAVTMNEYGIYVNYGRKKGKGIPPAAMNKWSKSKNLKPRDAETGAFIANTFQNRRAMSFMMNRKIKNFGIEPFPFMQMSREAATNKYRKIIKEATKKDIANNLGIILKKKR